MAPEHSSEYDTAATDRCERVLVTLPDATIRAAHNPEAWQTTSRAVGLAPHDGPERAVRLAALLPDAFTAAADRLPAHLRAEPIVASLTADMADRATSCANDLT